MFIIVEFKAGLVEVSANLLLSVSLSVIGPKWASSRENLLRGVANNTGPDQPAHPRSLISAFVIRFLKSTIFNLATGEI